MSKRNAWWPSNWYMEEEAEDVGSFTTDNDKKVLLVLHQHIKDKKKNGIRWWNERQGEEGKREGEREGLDSGD